MEQDQRAKKYCVCEGSKQSYTQIQLDTISLVSLTCAHCIAFYADRKGQRGSDGFTVGRLARARQLVGRGRNFSDHILGSISGFVEKTFADIRGDRGRISLRTYWLRAQEAQVSDNERALQQVGPGSSNSIPLFLGGHARARPSAVQPSRRCCSFFAVCTR